MKVVKKVAVMNPAGEWIILYPGDDLPPETEAWQTNWCVEHGFVEPEAEESEG